MPSSSRKLLIVLLGLCVLAFVVYRSSGFIHFSDFSGAKLLHAIREANRYYLVSSVLAIYACYALRALRWQGFQKNLGPSHFWTIYKLTLAGFSAIFLLGRAGEPIRPVLLARNERLPVASIFGIYFLERIYDFACMAVIAAMGLLLFQSHDMTGETVGKLQTAARTTGTLFALGVLASILFVVYLRLHGQELLERRLQGWLAAHGWRARIARILVELVRGVQTIRSWGDMALSVFYSAVHWFLVVVIYFWVSHSFPGRLGTINLGDAMLVMTFTLVGSAVQLPGVGGGSQVASFLAYTAIFGVEKEAATAAAIVLWLITFAACSLAGVPLLIHEGWSLGELKRMTEEKEKKEAAGEEAE